LLPFYHNYREMFLMNNEYPNSQPNNTNNPNSYDSFNQPQQPNGPYQQPSQTNLPPYQMGQGSYQPGQFPPPQYQPQSQYPMQQSPRQTGVKSFWPWYRRQKIGIKFGLGCLGLVAVFMLCGLCSTMAGLTKSQTGTTQTSNTTQANQASISKPKRISMPKPTPKPKPTQSSVQIESQVKAAAIDSTVSNIDKAGNEDKYKNLHFTGVISDFVKDDSGDTAGANISDPNDPSAVIQISFPSSTDYTKLNTGDIIEVWGLGGGTVTGQNAFGGTIQEAVVQTTYLTDQTTGYTK
jgi:hypothetical protein